jgi:hypothetical protein
MSAAYQLDLQLYSVQGEDLGPVQQLSNSIATAYYDCNMRHAFVQQHWQTFVVAVLSVW